MINLNMHDVTKVTIASEQHLQSSGRDFVSREIVFTFKDGTEQSVQLFSHEENITVEIK